MSNCARAGGLFAAFAALTSACLLVTDLDGFSGSPTPDGGSGSSGGLDANEASAAGDAATGEILGQPSIPCTPASGCEVLVTGQVDARDIVFYDGDLFWILFGNDGDVMRLDGAVAGAGRPTTNGPPPRRWFDLTIAADTHGSFLWARSGANDVQRFESASTCSDVDPAARLTGLGSELLVAKPTGIARGSCGSATTLIGDADVRALASDGVSTIWWSLGTGEIVTCEATSPAACAASRAVVATGQGVVTSMAADSAHGYWATQGPQGEIRAKLKGGGDPALLASGQAFPQTLFPSGGELYWTNLEGGTVMRASTSGTPSPRLLLSELSRPWGVFVAATAVYITESGAGRVLRVRR